MKNKLPLIMLYFISLAGLVLIFIFFRAGSTLIITQVRIPRLLLAWITGYSLAVVGYSFQIMLNNPLAEPYLLGVSAGAALGSILAALTGMIILMPLWGFAGAVSAIILVWSLAGLGGFLNKTRLILAGIIIGLFLSAVISLLMYFNQQDIGIIINVLMGNLGRIFSNSEWPVFLGIFIIANLLILYLFSLSRQLSILASGDLIAASLGIKAKVLRRNIFLIGSLLTGMTVAYAGIIGFVGLVIPHLTRIIFRNQRMSLVYSAFLGGLFLIFCDFLAQHLTIVEIPVGIITAFIGCPFFLLIMLRNK